MVRGVAVSGLVGLAPGGPAAGPGGSRADDRLDLSGDRAGFGGLEDAGVFTGQDQGGGQGLAGVGRGPRRRR